MKSGFFENTEIVAEDFARAFGGVLTNGIAMSKNVNAMLTAVGTGMSVSVAIGKCWINGHYGEVTAAETLTIPLSDGTYDRIDRIVARLDMSDKEIKLGVITGTPAAVPVAPDIVRNGTYYDLGIATVTVAQGTMSITSDMLTDTRLDGTVCGIVECTAADIDVDELFAEWQIKFNSWFANLQNQLDTNQAGHLQDEIDTLNAQIVTLTAAVAAAAEMTDTVTGAKSHFEMQNGICKLITVD